MHDFSLLKTALLYMIKLGTVQEGKQKTQMQCF